MQFPFRILARKLPLGGWGYLMGQDNCLRKCCNHVSKPSWQNVPICALNRKWTACRLHVSLAIHCTQISLHTSSSRKYNCSGHATFNCYEWIVYKLLHCFQTQWESAAAPPPALGSLALPLALPKTTLKSLKLAPGKHCFKGARDLQRRLRL